MIRRFTCCLPVLLLIMASTAAEPVWAQDSGDDSQAVWNNAKGPAVRARAPGLWVRAALGGPDITQTEDEADTPSRLQEIYIDVINTLFLGLNQLLPLLSNLFQGGDGPSGGIGELLITELANDGTNSFVEIYNPNSIRLELDNWAFCQISGCTGASELAGRVMEPGDILVLQLGGQFDGDVANGVVTLQVGTTLDDIGLYDFTGAAFGDPQDAPAMRDYLQWGDFIESFGLEDVAVGRGLWVSGSSIPDSLELRSFQLMADRLSVTANADDFVSVTFEQASLGALTPADLGAPADPDVR